MPFVHSYHSPKYRTLARTILAANSMHSWATIIFDNSSTAGLEKQQLQCSVTGALT